MTVEEVQSDKLSEGVRAVDRALDILLAFRPGDGSLAASELLKRVDLSRPTLYRLLRTLEQRGFLASSGEPRRYQLGPAVGQLAHAWNTDLNLVAIAQPAMHAVWEQTGETVALLLHRGQERVCVAELPSRQPLSFRRGIGHSESVVVGASGRAILAFLTSPESYLDDSVPLERKVAYIEELARIRKAGYAISRDELIKGAVAIAVPVLNSRGQVLGSLAVYGPSARIDEEAVQDHTASLQRATREITQKLG